MLMDNRKIDVIICDKSEIIVSGLTHIIRHNFNINYQIVPCHNVNDIRQKLCVNNPQILLINPKEIIPNNVETNVNLIKIALIYEYQDPSNLKKYDHFVYLNDNVNHIEKVLTESTKSINSKKPTSNKQEILTSREIEVLKLLVNGSSTKDISEELFISKHTVNNHRKNIIKKLGISTISGLTIYAVINKIIDPDISMKKVKKSAS